jgi:hypothetical protein
MRKEQHSIVIRPSLIKQIDQLSHRNDQSRSSEIECLIKSAYDLIRTLLSATEYVREYWRLVWNTVRQYQFYRFRGTY